MRIVPRARTPVAFAREVRADSPRSEHLRYVVHHLARLGHRSPLLGVAIDRADKLRMAIPTAFADIDSPPQLLECRSTRGGHGPAVDRLDGLRSGHGLLEEGEDALARHGEGVEAHCRNENDGFYPVHDKSLAAFIPTAAQ